MVRPTPQHVHRLVRWQRLALYAVGTLLLLTGTAWLAVHYSIGAGELPHPLEAWALRLHGLLAFGGTFVLGALAAGHIPQGWRISAPRPVAPAASHGRSSKVAKPHLLESHRRRWAGQRSSGLLLCGVGAVLVLSGYALYYFAPESVRPALGWAHAFVGVTMALLIASHRRGA